MSFKNYTHDCIFFVNNNGETRINRNKIMIITSRELYEL